MVTDADVLPRHGFTQMARNMRCQLYFPFPTDQVVLLRTGLLVHINAYMRSLGFSTDAHQSHPAAPSPHAHAQTDAAADGGDGGGGGDAAVSLKAHMAGNASAGVLEGEPMQGTGASSLLTAMDVDSSAGKELKTQIACQCFICCHQSWFHMLFAVACLLVQRALGLATSTHVAVQISLILFLAKPGCSRAQHSCHVCCRMPVSSLFMSPEKLSVCCLFECPRPSHLC